MYMILSRQDGPYWKYLTKTCESLFSLISSASRSGPPDSHTKPILSIQPPFPALPAENTIRSANPPLMYF